MPCSWVGRINIAKTTILPNAIYGFNPYKNTNGIFHRTRAKNLKICMEETKDLKKAKAVLRKKNGAGGINLSYFKLCYKATVIKGE